MGPLAINFDASSGVAAVTAEGGFSGEAMEAVIVNNELMVCFLLLLLRKDENRALEKAAIFAPKSAVRCTVAPVRTRFDSKFETKYLQYR